MTSTDRDTLKQLLHDLVAGIVSKPEAIEIGSQAAPGTCYWIMRVGPEDNSKAIGKEGSHAAALASLLAAWGEAEDEVHTFRLINSERRDAPPERIRDVVHYDPEPRRVLLERILAELALSGYVVAVGPGVGPRSTLTFEFSIRVVTEEDASVLLRPRTIKGVDGAKELPTVVAALGTLFRAIGRKDGVNFELRVARPLR